MTQKQIDFFAEAIGRSVEERIAIERRKLEWRFALLLAVSNAILFFVLYA